MAAGLCRELLRRQPLSGRVTGVARNPHTCRREGEEGQGQEIATCHPPKELHIAVLHGENLPSLC